MMNRNLGFKTIRFDDVSSTNAVLRDLIDQGIEPGTVVTAATQTSGKGRMARRWESPEGGLWLSVLLGLGNSFDRSKLGLIPLMAGASVATAIIMEYDLEAGLKWPNDVMANGRKVSGILAELVESGGQGLAIVGIGVNVNNRMKEGYDFSDSTTSIVEEFGKNVNISVLENTILEELNFRHGLLVHGDHSRILDDWRELSETLGRTVKVITPGGEYRGHAKDIDEHGSLLLDMDGRIERITVGDCRHLD